MDFSSMKMPALLRKYVAPQIVALVVNSLYFIVDGIFIGRRLGTGALAAAGVAVPVVEIVIALSMMISVGSGVLISAAIGQGDKTQARRIFNVSVRFTLGFALALMALGSLLTTPLARLLGSQPAILGDTVTYLRIFMLFCPFFTFSYALSTFVRNDGNPTLAMWALTLGSVLNILLDYVFMYPLNMGIGGAALATGLGPVFSVLLMLPHFLQHKGNLFLQKGGFPGRILGRILGRGLPAFVSEFTIGMVTLLYNLAIVRQGLGEDGLASYVVIGYAALICMAVFLGAAQGMQPAVSFFAGAGQPGRIRTLFKAGSVVSLVLGIGLYAGLFFGGRPLFTVFIGQNPALLEFTAQTARIYFLCLPFAALNILIGSFLQAMQQTRRSLAVSLSRSTLPLLAFLLVLPVVLPANGLWLAVTFTEAFTLLLGGLLWASMWRRHADTLVANHTDTVVKSVNSRTKQSQIS